MSSVSTGNRDGRRNTMSREDECERVGEGGILGPARVDREIREALKGGEECV